MNNTNNKPKPKQYGSKCDLPPIVTYQGADDIWDDGWVDNLDFDHYEYGEITVDEETYNRINRIKKK